VHRVPPVPVVRAVVEPGPMTVDPSVCGEALEGEMHAVLEHHDALRLRFRRLRGTTMTAGPALNPRALARRTLPLEP
jgi:hypothetical protein